MVRVLSKVVSGDHQVLRDAVGFVLVDDHRFVVVGRETAGSTWLGRVLLTGPDVLIVGRMRGGGFGFAVQLRPATQVVAYTGLTSHRQQLLLDAGLTTVLKSGRSLPQLEGLTRTIERLNLIDETDGPEEFGT